MKHFQVRKWLSAKKNYYSVHKKFKKLGTEFKKVIHGYHMINKPVIKESVWENINCQIVKNHFKISDQANGGHFSGKDNRFDDINISNKTVKTGKNGEIHLSSYRLSSVCNNKNTGIVENIIKEIESRDNSFDFYSLLVRHEKTESNIEYSWYVIPKDCDIFKVQELSLKFGKSHLNKDQIIGYSSKYCDINFSMSSQLWFKFNIKHIEKYKICSTEVDNSKEKINYSEIYDSLTKRC